MFSNLVITSTNSLHLSILKQFKMRRFSNAVNPIISSTIGIRRYSSFSTLDRRRLQSDREKLFPPNYINSNNFFSASHMKKSVDQLDAANYSHLFTPVPIKANTSEFNEGEMFSGVLKKNQVSTLLNKFYTDSMIRETAKDYGLDDYIYREAFMSFRQYCESSTVLPTELHVILCDIAQGGAHIHDVFPLFIEHAKRVFPHLVCLEDLCKVSDLTNPPNWYPNARSMKRKIVFHSGPTNSGKTYHAMQSFLSASSGVYCGPLKLLATEVYHKSNEKGTPCDLVTGEERKFAREDGSSSSHVACTAEMASVINNYDVAVIDEIQLLKDPVRGWAWTRAFLGLCAKEVHLCGEAAAIPLVEELTKLTGDTLEIVKYNRLTELTVEDSALCNLSKVEPGDCIVCFSKREILDVSRTVERLGHQVAVIYGGLPPGTKLAQAQKFNDPTHPCKIMVATDAIGMGLNLSIRRVIFNTIHKTNVDETGKKEMALISVSQALQIAGRAGRYGTQFEHGFVTAMRQRDLPMLRTLLKSSPEEIEQAGLHPTPDQIELFAYHLPTYNLSNLIDIFTSICKVDSSLYFMCALNDFKFLADLTQHIPLPLRSRYVFCCSPINKRQTFVCAMFLKFVRRFSEPKAATSSWICDEINWPLTAPSTVMELVHLEEVFDVCDLYLWLSYRFSDMFTDPNDIRMIQAELDSMITEGVNRITELAVRKVEDLTQFEEKEVARTVEKTTPAYIEPQKADSIQVTSDESRTQSSYSPQRVFTGSKSKPKHGKGRLTDHLISQGLISKDMLETLQQEWRVRMEKDSIGSDKGKNKSRRKKKP